ncbi:MAG: hypothetical protein IJS02_02870 [Bacteroidales bacterium]|nr:hypothetical protein [Bacteroidales bacterium]
MKAPLKMRIDNASNIYLASLTKKYATLFRLSATLSEPVDASSLQSALNRTVQRMPSFRYSLGGGIFWWQLKKIDEEPHISEPASLRRFSFKTNGGYLFRVSIDGNKIVLDIFHALTDGHGAMVFLTSLVTEYIRVRYGVYATYNDVALDPAQTPCPEEIEDSFDHFSGKKGELERNTPAYHIKGRKEAIRTLRDTRFSIPIKEIKAVTSKYDCSITDLLTAAMIYTIQEMQRDDRSRKKLTAVKVNVPVNLRPIFHSKTFRNFSSYVNVGVDVRNTYYTFEQILHEIKLQKQLYTISSNLEPKIAKNVELEDNFAIGCIPLFIKKHVIDFIKRTHGDKFCSHTLSNLGKVDLPEEIKPFVKEMDFILGRQIGNIGAASCIGCNGQLVLHFTRSIKPTDFETRFAAFLQELAIPLRISYDRLS